MEASEIDKIRNEMLEKINEYRRRHQAEPLILDSEINKYAQEWADKLIRKNGLAHRPNNLYGENIAMISGQELLNSIDLWYNEGEEYDYNSSDTNFKTLHFTQLVWIPSKKIGLGIGKDPNSPKYIIVANFDPKGNILRKFKENVLPPIN
uniref:SCP domain-containing protein n=1 Tax=Strongyloides stercoralis TaxID=6248 RepID=A0A0K0ELW1_STRER